MKSAQSVAMGFSEKGMLPDQLLRMGIRQLLRSRLKDLQHDDIEFVSSSNRHFIEQMNSSPIAPLPEKANEQHYELPPGFFHKVLGANLKYSCCYWLPETCNLDDAENEALAVTASHAGLGNNQSILELGCGWGSLSLWMASHYPCSRITAVSNSRSQGAYIREQARAQGLSNLEVITADINDFQTDQQFDRIVSVEMFEHLRNYREIYGRVASWLKPEGKFFKHIFVHHSCLYAFEDKAESDWMSRYFFSGGMMPCDDLPMRFQDDLLLEQQWRWEGKHYEKTANAWLENMDAQKDSLMPLFESTYGKDFAKLWWQRWRMFFMACAELFGLDNGQQWWVSHYLFSKRD